MENTWQGRDRFVIGISLERFRQMKFRDGLMMVLDGVVMIFHGKFLYRGFVHDDF